MRRTFDNFNAVDSGFASFVTSALPFPGVTLNQQTIATNSLITSLPSKYQTALEKSNLDFHLNASQSEALKNDIIAIANNTSLSGSAKISSAIAKIESALPYLKTPTTLPTRNSLPSVPTAMEVNTSSTMSQNAMNLSNQVIALALTDSAFFSVMEDFDNAVSKQDQQILLTQLEAIANDTSLTSQQKLQQAKALYENAVMGNSSNATRSTNDTSSSSPDYVKIGLIVLAVGIVGFMGYIAIKK